MHVRFPRLYLQLVFFKRRAAPDALGQISLIPGAALWTLHVSE